MIEIIPLLKETVARKASDVHLLVNCPPIFRQKGKLIPSSHEALTARHIEKMVQGCLSETKQDLLDRGVEVNASIEIPNIARFRINVYNHRGTIAVAIRVISGIVKSLDDLCIRPIVTSFAFKERGLIMVSGSTGAGKSTTIAGMIDIINEAANKVILCLEDPIEYKHQHKNSIIIQREIGLDTISFEQSINDAMRSDANVVMVGELRDPQTIAKTLDLAEAGYLVLTTFASFSACEAIDRMIGMFSVHDQQIVRTQLATCLQAVICQQLVPKKDEDALFPALEILIGNGAVRSLIKENKTERLHSVMESEQAAGMITMDVTLKELYNTGIIAYDEMYNRLRNPSILDEDQDEGEKPALEIWNEEEEK